LQKYYEITSSDWRLHRHRDRLKVDRAAVMRKLDDLQSKKGRILDAFFEGVIDRTRRDEALRDVENEIGSYNLLLGTSSAQPKLLPSLDSMLRMIEPLADWEFLARQERRALLRELCPDISVYQYKVNSLTRSGSLTANKPNLAAPSRFDEVRYVQEMARRIAAILLSEPARDANYASVKQHTFVCPTLT
jgi:hypothetical protein